MPQYAKTRKGAPEGFEYVTAKPVKVGEAEVIVGLGKSGAFKIATPQIDGATVTGKGKTFDDAINDLIFVMTPVITADDLVEADESAKTPETPKEAAPVKAKAVPVKAKIKAKVVPADKVADTLLSGLVPDADPVPEDNDADADGETEVPAPESRMTGGKLSALVMSAYRRSAEAVTAMHQKGITPAEVRKISKATVDEIAALCAEGREAGVDGERVERLRMHGVRLAENHYRVAGGTDTERLTAAQMTRLRKKFGSVAKSLAA